jgi:hypothetical protein
VVVREEWLQIEVFVDHLGDDARQVVFGEPLIEVGREDEGLLRVVLPERRAALGGHARQ